MSRVVWNRKTRRQFLIDGSSFLALPFLASLLPREAGAQAVGGEAKRFVSIFSPNGQRSIDYEPRAGYAFTSFPGDIRETNLQAAFGASRISEILDNKFNPFLNKLTLVRGLDLAVDAGHNRSAMLGHFLTSDSFATIDQVMARSQGVYGSRAAVLPILNLANQDIHSYRKSGESVVRASFFSSPQSTFNLLFNFSNPSTRDRSTKVLNRVMASYSSVKQSPQLSTEDKRMLDQYMSMFNDVAVKMNQIPQVAKPNVNFPDPAANQELRFQQMVDVTVLALQAGLTQIANICCTSVEGGASQGPNDGGWHGAHHAAGNEVTNRDHLVGHKLVADQVFLRLIQKMSQVSTSDGKTLLDQSLIFWGNELGTVSLDQPATWVHDTENMPVVIAGSGQNFIQPGRLLDYMQYGATPLAGVSNAVPAAEQKRPGRLYNQLLVTLLQGMGALPAEYATGSAGGSMSYGLTSSGKATRNARYITKIAEVGQVLPRIRG